MTLTPCPTCGQRNITATLQRRVVELEAEAYRLRAALERIAKWHGEFPAATCRGESVDYGYAYGSNGERDFMREVAREALESKA